MNSGSKKVTMRRIKKLLNMGIGDTIGYVLCEGQIG